MDLEKAFRAKNAKLKMRKKKKKKQLKTRNIKISRGIYDGSGFPPH